MEPGEQGAIDYRESLDKYFGGASCLPLFFTLDNRNVGFALVKLCRAVREADGISQGRTNFIEELYIRRPFRRKGLGTAAVANVIAVNPGRWMVSTWPGSVRVAFWRHVALSRHLASVTEYAPGEHKGFPGQYVWAIEPVTQESHDEDITYGREAL
jgi:predicted acetyltransferase